MMFAVYVKFLPGGSIAPEEFFARINAQWYWLEDAHNTESRNTSSGKTTLAQSPKSAICIADYDSIQQFAIDLAIMPGAGISNIEVIPLSDEIEQDALAPDISSFIPKS
jgi:hypothetical protein